MHIVKLIGKGEIEVNGFHISDRVAKYQFNDQNWIVPLSQLEYAKYSSSDAEIDVIETSNNW